MADFTMTGFARDDVNMPYDDDVIARLYPADMSGFAREVMENHLGHTPPRCPPPDLASRESTVEPEEIRSLGDELPYIEFKFSRPPRSSSGFVFGTRPNSDVALRDREGNTLPGLSRSHFALTYKNTFPDGRSRLVVRDLDSSHGTTVTYDAMGKDRRRKFDWTVSGSAVALRVQTLIIQPDPRLRFRLVVMHHNISSPAYNTKIQRFRGGASPAMDILHGLGLENGPATELQTGTHTPVMDPILIERELIAKNSSTIITHYWNVSTGEEYACKSPPGIRYDTRDWEDQMSVMGKVSHEHIARLCRTVLRPTPRLYLEYMPLGNLEEEHQRRPFSPLESLIILRQSLSALSYLHQPQRGLVHGQIHPRNILVQYRDAGDIGGHLHIKLSDFGSSRELRPSRRRDTYLPPDEEDGSPRDFNPIAGDIWSLGLVVFQIAYELPTRRGMESHLQWCDKVVAKVNSLRQTPLVDILQKMLVIDANLRHSASACLEAASRELSRFHPRSATPTQASYAGNGEEGEILAREIQLNRSPAHQPRPAAFGRDHSTSETPNAQPTLDFMPPQDDFDLLGHNFMLPQSFSPSGDLFNLPQDFLDLPESAFLSAVGPVVLANEAGYDGGPVQPYSSRLQNLQSDQPHEYFQPDQPALPSPGDLFLPEVGVPDVPEMPGMPGMPGVAGVSSPSPFISVELFDRYGEVGEEKMLRRLQNNEMAAIYNPLQRTINITSVLKGLRVGHKSHSRVIQAVTTDADTRVLRKTRVPGATGTWITFDRALRLADSADYLPHLKEVILAASRSI